MKNTRKFNLSKILSSVNSQLSILTDEVAELHLNDDNSLNLKMSGLTYCIDGKRLQHVLNHKKYNDKNEDFLNAVLSRHLVNKLMTLLGKKFYSQIKLIDFDID